MAGTEKRSVHQYIESIAPGGRGSRIGRGSGGEIAGRVRRRLGQIVDVVKLLMRVARKDKVVVSQVLVSFAQAEVKHHAGTCGLVVSPLVNAVGHGTASQLSQ